MDNGLEIFEHYEEGYKPLVYSRDWMVALLNYERIMALENAHEIERHVKTDEVFILLKGRAAFYLVQDDKPLQVVEMKPGLVYNVKKGTWHNLLATKDAVFAIVENRDTDKHDTQMRSLSTQERESLVDNLPGWLK